MPRCPEALAKYNQTMWGVWDTIDLIPVVGTVARAGQAVGAAVTDWDSETPSESSDSANVVAALRVLDLPQDLIAKIGAHLPTASLLPFRRTSKIARTAVSSLFEPIFEPIAERAHARAARAFARRRNACKALIEILKKHRLTIADLRGMTRFKIKKLNEDSDYEDSDLEWWAPGQAFAWFLRTYKNGVLKTLDLNPLDAIEIGDEGAKALASALRVNEALTDLNLGGNSHIEEAALSIVRVERHRNKLTSLGLLYCGIGPTGAAEIADFVSVSGVLTDLNLSENEIRNEGAAAIAEALRGNGVLTNLWLWQNNIGHEGAKALASALRVNEVLTGLFLNSNRIGDEGTKALASALRVNGVLTKLVLSRRS